MVSSFFHWCNYYWFSFELIFEMQVSHNIPEEELGIIWAEPSIKLLNSKGLRRQECGFI